jgi:protein subunit release factor B
MTVLISWNTVMVIKASMFACLKRKSYLTPVYPTDRESLERDCDLEFIIASGPGGQHRNKAETGVRLTHRPSGITVTATERRSQYANREAAFERMKARLEAMQHVQTPRKPTRPTAASRRRRRSQKRLEGMRKSLRSRPAEE